MNRGAILVMVCMVVTATAQAQQKQSSKPVPEKVWAYPDVPPKSKGDMSRYIADRFVYPDSLEAGIAMPDKILLSFTVNSAGYVRDIKLEKGSGSKRYDANAQKVIQHMNDSAALWLPALVNGKPVSSRFALPIMTCLQ